MPKATCAACQQELEVTGRVGRRDECPHCHADLHACVQCYFYDEAYHNACREPQAERVLEKTRSNFCGYFVLGRGDVARDQEKESIKQALDDLFKKG